MTKTETDTSKIHKFVASGCVNQWHADHDDADCWQAFIAEVDERERYAWEDGGRSEHR